MHATVLVVEDDDDVREYIVSALIQLGYDVLQAGEASAALSVIECHPEVDMLLTDVGLPGINGRQLADEASRRHSGIKILFISGYAKHAIVHNGADGLKEDDDRKAELAQKICLALKVHAQIEEEIFYPQAREATKDNDLIDEAVVEHATVKNLIAEIESMEVGEDLYDAKIRLLGEMVQQHIKEEEEELFPELGPRSDERRVGKECRSKYATNNQSKRR